MVPHTGMFIYILHNAGSLFATFVYKWSARKRTTALWKSTIEPRTPHLQPPTICVAILHRGTYVSKFPGDGSTK